MSGSLFYLRLVSPVGLRVYIPEGVSVWSPIPTWSLVRIRLGHEVNLTKSPTAPHRPGQHLTACDTHAHLQVSIPVPYVMQPR